MAAYPNDEKAREFKKLAGLFLATRSLTEALVDESTDIMTIEVDTIREHSVVAKIFDRASPKVRHKTSAALNSIQVRPVLDPEAPINASSSFLSTKNMYKVTYGDVKGGKVMLVVCLPYRMPDNLCRYAATQATKLF